MNGIFGRRREPGGRADRVKLDGADAGGAARMKLSRRRMLTGFLLVVGFLVVLELLFPLATPVSDVVPSVGQIAREEIVAPFEFQVLKTPEALEQERAMAEAGVVPVFRFEEAVLAGKRKELGDFVERVYDVREGDEPDRQKLDLLGQLGIALSDTTRRVLLDARRSARVEERAREILFGLYGRGIIESRGLPGLLANETVAVVRDDEETLETVGAFLEMNGIEEIVSREARRDLGDAEMTRATVEIVMPFVTENVIHDPAETRRRRAAARELVTESTGRDFKRDEVIVSRGERITTDHVAIIRSMNVRRAQLLRMEAGHRRYFPSLGRALEAALLLGAFALYVAVRRRSVLIETRCQVLFAVLIAVVMATAAGIQRIPEASAYLVPVTLLAMLASMLFTFEIAVVSTFVTVILVSIYTGFGLPFIFVSLVAGVVGAHSVRRVRHREDFYWSGIRIVATYAAAIVIADIASVDLGLATLTRAGWGGLNAIVSMGVVVVALPLFERGFRVTTDITLLELADMNKPLLRKMAMTAPGTYHHSIVVGNLAEAAAEAIGAHGLLARVGAYYHDIGKLVNPGYFIENQQGLDSSESKHTGLKPKVSSLIIGAHVKDGVELARKERLPEPLIDVIREHHGTSVMEYFYNRAREEAEDADDVNAGDYSYPGPRPRSKESAIIGLADTIEARVRSAAEVMSPKRIESEIDEVIEKRWREHQLDDAELTLSDLRKIREAFLRVVVGMYHQRIKYPDQDEGEGDPDEGDPGGTAPGDEPRDDPKGSERR